MKTITNKISKSAQSELRLLRAEMKKSSPNIDLIFELISGTKYNVKIGRK